MLGAMRLAMVGIAASLVAASGAARAEAPFPSKLITFVVNFPPGGPSDILARLVGTHVAQALGQPVIVENKPGATGAIGAAAVAKGVADGHTVLFAIDTTFTVTPTLQPGLFDPTALKPVLVMVTSGSTLTVHPSVPAETAAALLALGRREPITFASGGNGSPGHLGAAILMARAGIQVVHVPYRGNTPAVLALVQGEAQAGVLATPGVLPHIQAGGLRALAVTSAARSALLPAVPSLGELGLPELQAETLFLAFVPTATPQPAVAVLAREMMRALERPEVRERLIQLDMTPAIETGPAVAARLAALRERYAAVIRTTGMTAD
jgi:tripartite-type tricarboxylate transporter receptor subunit TctC